MYFSCFDSCDIVSEISKYLQTNDVQHLAQTYQGVRNAVINVDGNHLPRLMHERICAIHQSLDIPTNRITLYLHKAGLIPDAQLDTLITGRYTDHLGTASYSQKLTSELEWSLPCHTYEAFVGRWDSFSDGRKNEIMQTVERYSRGIIPKPPKGLHV